MSTTTSCCIARQSTCARVTETITWDFQLHTQVKAEQQRPGKRFVSKVSNARLYAGCLLKPLWCYVVANELKYYNDIH